jgi:hypothetical protein
MDDDKIAFRHDYPMLVALCVWQAFDKVEETLASRCDVSAVLDIVWRPEALGSLVIAFVKERVESFEHDGLIRLFGSGINGLLLWLSLVV